jgi:signal transduction histidine kinase
MMFSLFGYLFGARNFYAIPGLSAIALPTSTMLLALAVSLVISVPDCQPMLLLCERSSAGAMARTVLPILIVMIPSVTWIRSKGYELELFDLGTGRALGAAVLVLGVVVLMWIALLALRRREQREREADRRKDEFLATLAHELRNPLAPINNATSLLKVAYEDRDVFQQATETIERQLAQLVRLIDDLLDASRISQGKLQLRRERVELAAIVRQAIETCRPIAECAKHEVTVRLPQQPVCRHPLNFAPLPILWLWPRMTTSLLAFNTAATIYLVVGSIYEEARLREAFGEEYDTYQKSGIAFYVPIPNRNAVEPTNVVVNLENSSP